MINRLDEARRIFHQKYGNSRNLMTPNLVELNMIGSLAYEISSGKGIDDEDIYGVTVVESLLDGSTKFRKDLSNLFHTMGQVRNHISNVLVPASNLTAQALSQMDEKNEHRAL